MVEQGWKGGKTTLWLLVEKSYVGQGGKTTLWLYFKKSYVGQGGQGQGGQGDLVQTLGKEFWEQGV